MRTSMATMIVGMAVLVGKRCGIGYMDMTFLLRSIHGMRIECPGGRKTNQTQHDHGGNGFAEFHYRLA